MSIQDKKVRVNYTVSEKVVKQFTKAVKENAINRSALIEILITKWLEQFKKEEHGK